MENDTFKELVINKVGASMHDYCSYKSSPYFSIILQKYRLVLTGHSLGAAVSSVLAVFLKHRHPEWTENLRAFNFATPPVFK